MGQQLGKSRENNKRAIESVVIKSVAPQNSHVTKPTKVAKVTKETKEKKETEFCPFNWVA
jgi:hypothetical protein